MHIHKGEMKLLLALVFVIFVFTVSAQAVTRYARSDGGPVSRCTGLVNAADTGSGSSQPCALNNFQEFLTALQCGDTGQVRAGDIFDTPAGTFFTVPAKVTGCVNTIADLITVESSAKASLPTGRVSASDASNMFQLRANHGYGVLSGGADSPKWWKFDGMEVTNTGTTFANTLVAFGGTSTPPEVYGDHFTFTRMYVHPQEGTTSNYQRTGGTGMVWNAGDLTMTKSLISGFWGVYGGTARADKVFTVNATTDIFSNVGGGNPCCVARVGVVTTGTLPAPLTADPTYYWPVGTRHVTDAVTSSNTTVTSATFGFAAGDTGKTVIITDGTNFYENTITYVNATTITLASNASWTGTGNVLSIRENDTFKLAATRGGVPIDITTTGTGTNSFYWPQAINTGAFWTNVGGPYLLDNNNLSANYNTIFTGAGASGSGNVGTISSPTISSFTLTNTTNLDVGDLMAVQVHVPSWSTTIGYQLAATAVASTDRITMDSPYNSAHELLNDDVIYCTNSSSYSDTAVPAPGLTGYPTRYYVVNKTTSDFQVSTTRGGSAANITADDGLFVGIAGHAWAVGTVGTVDHGTGAVTMSAYVRYEGYGQTPQLEPPFDHVASTALPFATGVVKWEGYNVHDFTLTHNTVELDLTSATYVFNRTGSRPKGYSEIKDLKTALWEGNTFQGWPNTPIAMVLSNQNGTSPWSTVQDFTFRSNLITNFTVVAFIQLSSSPPTLHGKNIVITNNLAYGNATYGTYNGPGWVLAGVGGGQGTPMTVTHNTVVNAQDVDGGYMFTGAIIPMPFIGSGGAIIKDNIMWWNRNGIQGAMATYYPNLVEDQNLLVDDPNNVIGSGPMLAKLPNSVYAASNTAVKFVGGTCNSTANCVLASDSPGHLTATDGTDMGVDITTLNAALAGGGGGSGSSGSGARVTGKAVIKGKLIKN